MSDVEKENSNPATAELGGISPGRCLVLVPGDAAVSGALLSALGKRGLAVHLVGDEPSVMVELAQGDCAVLVAVDPPAWPRLAELAYAIRQHYPAVHCWQFAQGNDGRPHLSGLARDYLGPKPPRQPADSLSAAAATNERATQATIERLRGPAGQTDSPIGDGLVGPVGRIRGRRRHIGDLVIRAPHAPSPSDSLISEEELTMLLGPTPGEAS